MQKKMLGVDYVSTIITEVDDVVFLGYLLLCAVRPYDIDMPLSGYCGRKQNKHQYRNNSVYLHHFNYRVYRFTMTFISSSFLSEYRF